LLPGNTAKTLAFFEFLKIFRIAYAMLLQGIWDADTIPQTRDAQCGSGKVRKTWEIEMSKTTERIVKTYSDNKAIGTIEMTDKQYARYVAESDPHTGAMLFSDLMTYGCEYVASETCDEDVTIFVEA
jgi:hypothetical protein